MINIHIKGDLKVALKQCDKRRIELMAVQCRWRAGIPECFASCADTVGNRDQVALNTSINARTDLVNSYVRELALLVVFNSGE